MEDVTTNLRDTFLDEGVDEDVLNLLIEVIYHSTKLTISALGSKISRLMLCKSPTR